MVWLGLPVPTLALQYKAQDATVTHPWSDWACLFQPWLYSTKPKMQWSRIHGLTGLACSDPGFTVQSPRCNGHASMVWLGLPVPTLALQYKAQDAMVTHPWSDWACLFRPWLYSTKPKMQWSGIHGLTGLACSDHGFQGRVLSLSIAIPACVLFMFINEHCHLQLNNACPSFGVYLSKDIRHATEKDTGVWQVRGRSEADLSKDTRHATEKHWLRREWDRREAEVEQTFPKTQDMLQKNTGEGVRQARGRSGADLSKDTRHATEKHRGGSETGARQKWSRPFQRHKTCYRKRQGSETGRQAGGGCKADLSKKTRHATEKDGSETGAMQKWSRPFQRNKTC